MTEEERDEIYEQLYQDVDLTRRNIIDFVRDISEDSMSAQDLNFLEHKIQAFKAAVVEATRPTYKI